MPTDLQHLASCIQSVKRVILPVVGRSEVSKGQALRNKQLLVIIYLVQRVFTARQLSIACYAERCISYDK